MASYDNVDPKEHAFSGEVNYELPGLSFSARPTVGMGYSTISDEGSSISALTVPVGVGFGQRFELSPEMSVNPFVRPQWVWTRVSLDVLGEESSADDSMLAAQLGATLAMARFYVGGGLTWYNEDDVDPVFAIFAGLPF